MRPSNYDRWPQWLITGYSAVLAILSILVSYPEIGELLFRGYFVQDADEVIRAWYGRCSFTNPAIIPYSHLSMPGWTLLLALGENIAALFGLPLTMAGRLITVFFSWWCLRGANRWIGAIGGSVNHRLIGVFLIASSPSFFLLALSVYPAIAFASIVVNSMAFWASKKHRAALLTMAFAPLIRWEGVLLVALMAVVLMYRRQLSLIGWLIIPYSTYLLVNAMRFGNPIEPLAFRTTRHMGSWLIFNPHLTWERLAPALVNLVTLYSPLILIGGLVVSAGIALRKRDALGPIPWAFSGLTIALLSIQHEWSVWVLRVFLTPTVLGVLVLVGAAVISGPKLGKIILAIAAVGTLTSTGSTFVKVNNQTIPAEGGFRAETGYHMFVRYADASPALDWINSQDTEWVIVNHLNANLFRADGTCSLWNQPLRLGSPGMSLSRSFEPVFELPSGEGLVVFHTGAVGVERCKLDKHFQESHLQIYRCGNSDTESEVNKVEIQPSESR